MAGGSKTTVPSNDLASSCVMAGLLSVASRAGAVIIVSKSGSGMGSGQALACSDLMHSLTALLAPWEAVERA